MPSPGLRRERWQPKLRAESGASPLLRSRVVRLLCFSCTGIIAALVQLGLLEALTESQWSPIWAEVAALVISTQVNFFLSYLFTWRDRRPRGWMPRILLGQWVAYQGTAALAATVNMSVFLLGRTDLHVLAASALGTAVAASINFVAGDRFVFRPRALVAVEPVKLEAAIDSDAKCA
jgi:putative flippase GtrA